jgi:predicted metal-dependent peptidase
LFNIANDYCVNADLKKHGVGEFITTVPCLYDRRYEGMSSEEIYDILFANAKKIDINALINQLLDEHLDGDGDEGGNKSKDGDGTGRPQLSEAEKQEIRDEIKEAVLSAAQASGAGNLPAGVLRIIQELTEPKMNWRELLRMQLESTIKSDYTWMRANRKGWHMDAVLPGMKLDPMIDIAVGIDMSGSVTDEMGKDFLGEIQGIMDSFPAYRIHVFSFDTEVHNPVQFDSDNLTSITEYEPMGGGGTDFVSIFDYLKREEIEPKRLVVFTDGEPYGSWGDPNYCDTVWIIHSNPDAKPPFGTWAEYKEQD